MDIHYDRSLLGMNIDGGPFEVTRSLIEGFCKSIGEHNPVFFDESVAQSQGYKTVIAPPTLCSIFIRRMGLPDISLKFGKTRFHAGQMIEPIQSIYAGDSLMGSAYLKDIYPKTGRSGTMIFIIWETVFKNQQGEVVASIKESYAAKD